jgi:hypothetical protein
MQQLLPAALCFWQAAYIDAVLTVELGSFWGCHTESDDGLVVLPPRVLVILGGKQSYDSQCYLSVLVVCRVGLCRCWPALLALICVMFGFLHTTSHAAVMHTHVSVCLSSCKYSCWTCHAFVHQMMVAACGLAGAVGATNGPALKGYGLKAGA